MLKKSGVVDSAFRCLVGALAGPWAAPGAAASGQICCFGGPRASASPSASVPSNDH
jgi:hypothetical protein